jgi:hypothetical protein
MSVSAISFLRIPEIARARNPQTAMSANGKFHAALYDRTNRLRMDV